MKVVLNFPWNTLIDTALQTQKNYIFLDKSQLLWLKGELYNIYKSDLDINLKYKCLVLLNRSIKHGRYALLFNKKVMEATSLKDKNLLFMAFKNPCLDELNVLPEKEKTKWLSEIDNHILSLNLYLDRLIIFQNSLYTFQTIDENMKCYDNSCSEDIIYFSDKNANYTEMFAILEIDLMFLLLSKNENPYSNKEFSLPITKIFYKKYCDILLVCKEAYKHGYKHTYRL